MAENASEAREKMAYGKAKAIASWYLDQRKKKNQQALNLDEEEAWKRKQEQDEASKEARRQKAEEKKRKHQEKEAEEDKENELPKKKPRPKRLQTSVEERDHWKAKTEKKKALGADVKKHSKGKDQTQSEAKAKAIRAICFRLYPSPGLLRWIAIADAIDSHVKEVTESFAERGEKVSFEYMRDEYICLSRKKYDDMEKESRLHELKDLERRRPYMEMPYDVQQATVKETVANAKANQTNYERGHNHGYEVRDRDTNRRWRTL